LGAGLHAFLSLFGGVGALTEAILGARLDLGAVLGARLVLGLVLGLGLILGLGQGRASAEHSKGQAQGQGQMFALHANSFVSKKGGV